MDSQLCCPSLVPEMADPVCEAGFGCTNKLLMVYERRCAKCGAKGSPCCWDPQQGYHCSENLSCTGKVGGVLPS
jgi:hypothetical protein